MKGCAGSAWPTATTDAGLYNRKGASPTSGDGLATAARLWGTPRASDAEQGFSRPDPETAPHGPPSSDPRHTWRRLRRLVISTHGRAVWRRMAANGGKRRLNPNFVAWLMAWPIGHSSCVCSEMEFSRWLRDMRGALSRLPTASGPWIWAPPKEAPTPVQIEMFGG